MPKSRIIVVDLSVARQENALAQRRDLAGLAFVQASQKNYGLSAGTSKLFFSRTREVASRTQDPKRSALNGFCQMHDVPNVFVVDGSAFTTATEKNPALTILALAWRATDYLASEMKSARL